MRSLHAKSVRRLHHHGVHLSPYFLGRGVTGVRLSPGRGITPEVSREGVLRGAVFGPACCRFWKYTMSILVHGRDATGFKRREDAYSSGVGVDRVSKTRALQGY
jgi:hypothetical protein